MPNRRSHYLKFTYGPDKINLELRAVEPRIELSTRRPRPSGIAPLGRGSVEWLLHEASGITETENNRPALAQLPGKYPEFKMSKELP